MNLADDLKAQGESETHTSRRWHRMDEGSWLGGGYYIEAYVDYRVSSSRPRQVRCSINNALHQTMANPQSCLRKLACYCVLLPWERSPEVMTNVHV